MCEPLVRGARYFDVPLDMKASSCTHHGPKALGVPGQSRRSILHDVNEFLNRDLGELVIPKLSKTKGYKDQVVAADAGA